MLDIQPHQIFINGMVHLLQEGNFDSYTDELCFTSYTTLTLADCWIAKHDILQKFEQKNCKLVTEYQV